MDREAGHAQILSLGLGEMLPMGQEGSTCRPLWPQASGWVRGREQEQGGGGEAGPLKPKGTRNTNC
jgi:hypothetical protein